MTVHVAVVGIDGSGKSTVVSALPAALSSALGVVAGAAGDDFRVTAPEQDFVAPGFHPDGLPWPARLSKLARRRAKRTADDRRRYPYYKLAQMILQDGAARRLAHRYGADVFVSDGNALLSATGRAANYLRPRSDGGGERALAPDASDLLSVFHYILDDVPLPEESAERLPDLARAKSLQRLVSRLGVEGVWLPDAVLFLDLPPEEALERIRERGGVQDRHENLEDLEQAREMYLETLEAFAAYRSVDATLRLPISGSSPGDTLDAAVTWVESHLQGRSLVPESSSEPLGTTSTDLGSKGLVSKVLSYRYLVRYLLARWREGSWREPLFVLSPPGRRFLEEGYSARVMRDIYEGDEATGLAAGIFRNYPLHRAVYDRLQILNRQIEPELERRLLAGARLTVFTAPSGFAYDLLRPLEAVHARSPEAMKRVHVLAADLDPHGDIGEDLLRRAGRLGIDLTFIKGDLTSAELRERFDSEAKLDVALFVGLSAWIPKPALMSHLGWLGGRLAEGGVVVTDVFTPAAYALSGKYVGYEASYYEPAVFRCLLDHVGFDGLGAEVASGRDDINHVFLARLRR